MRVSEPGAMMAKLHAAIARAERSNRRIRSANESFFRVVRDYESVICDLEQRLALATEALSRISREACDDPNYCRDPECERIADAALVRLAPPEDQDDE